MRAPWLKRLILAALPAIAALTGAPQALAQCCAPPPCCAPPTPPTPAPPCCGSGGHQIRVPGVNVQVGASVIVNASATAVVNASASGAGGANITVLGGGGGSSFGVAPGAVSLIQGLNVEGGAKQRAAYQATRTRIRIIVIRAVCIDDRNVPHAASQVTPGRDIGDSYEGELYRCIAGARLQVTFTDWQNKVDFDKGETLMCAKGEALHYSGGSASVEGGQRAGRMECRPQRPARDCNERSLLRRYGAGVKVIKIVTTETYTAYREETIQSAETRSMSLSLDGGVGGIAY